MSFESASLDAIRWERNELKKADALYWQGKETGLSDADFDAMSADCGHISQPPRTLAGWARYPDYKLLKPHFGLKKVGYDIAQKAVCFFPKWDGIYIQTFEDEKGCHVLTRGNGRTGKDLQKILLFPTIKGAGVGCYELCYSLEKGGRAQLCADLSKGMLKRFVIISHAFMKSKGAPPKEVPQEIDGIPCDGWVIELADGQKFAYKGQAYE